MEKVRIQDDLFTYVNQETLDKLVIPDDQPTAGGFQTLAVDVEKLLINDFKEMSESGNYPNEYMKNACTLFKIVKNVEKREADGIAPALKNASKVSSIKDMKEFSKAYKTLKLSKIPLPFRVLVDTDMKNAKAHCVCIQGPSVILPDASYYKEDKAAQKDMILGIWTNVAKMILAKTDLSAEDQAKYLEDTIAFDALIAGLVKTREDLIEYKRYKGIRYLGIM